MFPTFSVGVLSARRYMHLAKLNCRSSLLEVLACTKPGGNPVYENWIWAVRLSSWRWLFRRMGRSNPPFTYHSSRCSKVFKNWLLTVGFSPHRLSSSRNDWAPASIIKVMTPCGFRPTYDLTSRFHSFGCRQRYDDFKNGAAVWFRSTPPKR